MFIDAVHQADQWLLRNHWGHVLTLPALAPAFAGTVRIGTLATKFVVPAGDSRNRTELLAAYLGELDRPLIIVDTRRNGCGAQSSWSPEQFATRIPEALGPHLRYEFLHLPVVAPTLDLLEQERRGDLGGWRVFRDRYAAGLSARAVAVVVAFAEAAASAGGMLILLCAEPLCADFERLPPERQDEVYCHRFTLAARVQQALRERNPGAEVVIEHLDASQVRPLARSGGRNRAQGRQAGAGREPGRAVRPPGSDASSVVATLNARGAALVHEASFIAPTAAEEWLHVLLEAIQFDAPESSRVFVRGRWHSIPRLQAAFGDPGTVYRFSGTAVPGKPWIEPLAQLRDLVAQRAGFDPNFVLCNLYRNGADSIGWHADDERDLEPGSCIASLSLGAARDFQFRPRATAQRRDVFTLLLQPGSLLLMDHPTNRDFQHQLPRRGGARPERIGARLNLTFRRMRV